MAVPDTSKRIEEARKQSKTKSPESEATFKEVLSKGPGSTDGAARDYENALMGLGELYRDEKRADDLAKLVQDTRTELSNLPKAKTAKIGTSEPPAESQSGSETYGGAMSQPFKQRTNHHQSANSSTSSTPSPTQPKRKSP